MELENQPEGNPAGGNGDGAPAGSPPENAPAEGGNPNGDNREQFIPRERFDQVYNELKTEKERREDLESRFGDLESRFANKDDDPNKRDDPSSLDEDGLITKKDLREWEEKQKDRAFSEQIESRHKSLEKEIDGADGRPAYKKAEIVAYVRRNPDKAMADPLDVYKLMHLDRIADWKADQKLKAQKGDKVDTTPPAPKKPDAPKNFKTSAEHDAYVREKYGA